MVGTFLILVFAYRIKKILEISSCLIVLFYNTDKRNDLYLMNINGNYHKTVFIFDE